jgi:ABC-type sugar transport system substrate-binding protein
VARNQDIAMSGKKLKVAFEIYPDSFEMLMRAAEQHGIADASKALRCVLDYVATDGDWTAIFGTVRCRRCG